MASRLDNLQLQGEHPSFSVLGDKSYLQSTPNRYRVQRNGPPLILSSTSEASTLDSFQEQQRQRQRQRRGDALDGELSSASEQEEEEEEDADTEYAGTARKPLVLNSIHEQWNEQEDMQIEQPNTVTMDRRTSQLQQQAPSTSSSTLVNASGDSIAGMNVKTRSTILGLQRPVSAPPIPSSSGIRRVSPLQEHIDRFTSLESHQEQEEQIEAQPADHVHIPDPMASFAQSQVDSLANASNASQYQQGSSSVARVHDIFARHIHNTSTSTSLLPSRNNSLAASRTLDNTGTARPRQRLRDLLAAGNVSRTTNNPDLNTSRQRESSADTSTYEPSRAFKTLSPLPLARSRTVPTHSNLSVISQQEEYEQEHLSRRKSTPTRSFERSYSSTSLLQGSPSPSRRKRRQQQQQQQQQQAQDINQSANQSRAAFAKQADLERLERSTTSHSSPRNLSTSSFHHPRSVSPQFRNQSVSPAHTSYHQSSTSFVAPANGEGDESDLLAQQLEVHNSQNRSQSLSFSPIQVPNEQDQHRPSSRLEREWLDIANRTAAASIVREAEEEEGNEGDIEPEEPEDINNEEGLDNQSSLANVLPRHRHVNPIVKEAWKSMEEEKERSLRQEEHIQPEEDVKNRQSEPMEEEDEDDSSSFSPSLGGGDASQSPEVQESYSSRRQTYQSTADEGESSADEVANGASISHQQNNTPARPYSSHTTPARNLQNPAYRHTANAFAHTPLANVSSYKHVQTPLAPKTPHPPGWVAFTPQSTSSTKPVSNRQVSPNKTSPRGLSGMTLIQGKADEAEESLERSRTRLLGLPGSYASPFPVQARRVVSATMPSSEQSQPIEQAEEHSLPSISRNKGKAREEKNNHSVRFASPVPSPANTPVSSPSNKRSSPSTSCTLRPTSSPSISNISQLANSPSKTPVRSKAASSTITTATTTPEEKMVPSSISDITTTSAPSTPSRSRSESTESIVHGLLSDLVKPLKSILGGLGSPSPDRKGKGRQIELDDSLVLKKEEEGERQAIEQRRWRTEQNDLLNRINEADRLDRSLSLKIHELRNAMDELSLKVSNSVSNVLSDSFARESNKRRIWFLFAILAELLIVWIIFSIANVRADLLRQTSYRDDFYPALYSNGGFEMDRRRIPFLRPSLFSSAQEVLVKRDSTNTWIWIYFYLEKLVMSIVGLGVTGKQEFMHGTLSDHLTSTTTATLGRTAVTAFRVPT